MNNNNKLSLPSLPCCGCCNLTIATRWIGVFGLALSTALTTVLISDKHTNDFDRSRRVAAALGLDWQLYHHAANATKTADYDGKLISLIMVFYSTIYLLTNMILIFASITENRWCAMPWLGNEIFSCLSKMFAMLHHHLYQHLEYSTLFYIGSFLYIAIGSWWIVVVYLAQRRWAIHREMALQSAQKDDITLNRIERVDDITFATALPVARFMYFCAPMPSLDIECPDYEPNSNYAHI